MQSQQKQQRIQTWKRQIKQKMSQEKLSFSLRLISKRKLSERYNANNLNLMELPVKRMQRQENACLVLQRIRRPKLTWQLHQRTSFPKLRRMMPLRRQSYSRKRLRPKQHQRRWLLKRQLIQLRLKPWIS